MGVQSDRTVVCVTDAKTDKCHAIFKSSTIQYKETYRFLYTLIYQYIPNSVIVIENNIDTLIEYVRESELKHLLYYETPKDVTKEARKNGIIMHRKSSNIVYGVTTSAQNRPIYFDILFEYVRNNKDNICCRELVEEIESLEYKTPTRIEAASKRHDDVVFAYLIGQYVKQHGTNKARFGLVYSTGNEEIKTSNDSIFRNQNNFNDREIQNPLVSLNNPFWAELITSEETLEDMDRRWNNYMRRKSGERVERVTSNVFSSKADEMGIKTINEFAFDTLNSRNGYDVDMGGNDDAAFGSSSPFEDDSDSPGWF